MLRGGDGFEEGCNGADTDGTETDGAETGGTESNGAESNEVKCDGLDDDVCKVG